jgi:uncharacterized membrane-anchored protein
MNWISYLNFVIFDFYSKRDSDPDIYSFCLSTLLMAINVMSIFFLLDHFYSFLSKTNNTYVLILFVIIGLFNYFLVYLGGKHKDIFEKYRSSGRVSYNGFWMYIMVSLITIIVTSYVASQRYIG